MNRFISFLICFGLSSVSYGVSFRSFFELPESVSCGEKSLQSLGWYFGDPTHFQDLRLGKESSLKELGAILNGKNCIANSFFFKDKCEMISNIFSGPDHTQVAILHCKRQGQQHFVFAFRGQYKNDFVWIMDGSDVFYVPVDIALSGLGLEFSGNCILVTRLGQNDKIIDTREVEKVADRVKDTEGLTVTQIESGALVDKQTELYTEDFIASISRRDGAELLSATGSCSCFRGIEGGRRIPNRGFLLLRVRFVDKVTVGPKKSHIIFHVNNNQERSIVEFKIGSSLSEDIRLRFIKLVISEQTNSLVAGLHIPEQALAKLEYTQVEGAFLENIRTQERVFGIIQRNADKHLFHIEFPSPSNSKKAIDELEFTKLFLVGSANQFIDDFLLSDSNLQIVIE